jgi:hypothetical protein
MGRLRLWRQSAGRTARSLVLRRASATGQCAMSPPPHPSKNMSMPAIAADSGDAKPTDLANSCEPTPQERLIAKAPLARSKENPAAPRVKVSEKDGVAQIAPDHVDLAVGQALLMRALGTTDPYFADGLLCQLANAGTQGQTVDERALNFMLAVVKGIEPQDQVEAMLAAQLAAVHNATMTFARRLAHVETIPQQDSAERAFNKLARTFAAQVEALKRYRSRGEQTVRVEHVTVNEGGQAIVGAVTHGGRGSSKKTEPSP